MPRTAPARYLSAEGWQTFDTYLQANFEHLLGLRDAGPSRGAPDVHAWLCAARRRGRPAGLGIGPWLYPSVLAYAIPEADYEAVAALLIGRLAALLAEWRPMRRPFPTCTSSTPARLRSSRLNKGSAGVSGDWVNEIHLNRHGCETLAVPWAAAIEQVIRTERGED